MAQYSSAGVYYPTAEDGFRTPADLELLAKSIPGLIVPVLDESSADAYLAARQAEGRPATSTDPAFVVLSDGTVMKNDGTGWDQLVVASPWAEVANNSGWGAYATGTFFKVRRLGDEVELSQAHVKRASSDLATTAGQNVVVGYLPTDLRPTVSATQAAMIRYGGTVGYPCWLQAEPNGEILIKIGSDTGTLLANTSAHLIQTSVCRWKLG